MPSPIAHLSVGCLLALKFRRRFERWRAGSLWLALLLCGLFLFFSMLPDVDAVYGILVGDLGRYHNQWTHSLVALVGATVLGGFLFFAFLRERLSLCFLAAFACYGSHILLDFFCHGRGLMLLWPFSEARFSPHVYLFMGVHWSDGVWSAWHLLTALNEIIFAFLMGFLVRWKTGRL